MICKCFSILLLCSVPLIGMEKDESAEAEKNKDRAAGLAFCEVANRLDPQPIPVVVLEEGELTDAEKKKSREEGLHFCEYVNKKFEAHPQGKEYKKSINKMGIGWIEAEEAEERLALSQVSPCLYTLEDYLKQPDTTLASNAVRDCIRKLVELFRGTN